jgi:hypothetical protein
VPVVVTEMPGNENTMNRVGRCFIVAKFVADGDVEWPVSSVGLVGGMLP